MNDSQSKSGKVLWNGTSKHDALRETNRKGRIIFEVLARGKSSKLGRLSEVLKSEGWMCEGNRLILTVPKDALSSGNKGRIKAVHNAIAKMKYLFNVAQMDYNMMVISEASATRREGEESVAKLKVGLIGDPEVGKTSLIRRFVLDQFDDRYVRTIGAKVSKKEISLPLSKSKRLSVDMMIWDILGEKDIADLYIESHFKGMQGVLAVCDVTRNGTLSSINGWTSSVFHVAGKVPTYILVNKADLEGQFEIEKSDVRKHSKSLGSPFIFTSAKTGKNVERAFYELAQRILFKKDRKGVSIIAH
ncbi:MAG: Rab family GTPase [Thermoplasmata archaeon]